MSESIFYDFNLPNSPSWFYFSLFLTVTLFVKFSRLISLRNWDLLALFALVPGLLLIQEAYGMGLPTAERSDLERDAQTQRGLLLAGYTWLLAGSGYWLLRCLADLAIPRRPTWPPNLNRAGLICLTLSLLVCLTAVAVRREPALQRPLGKGTEALQQVEERTTTIMTAAKGDVQNKEIRFWVRRGLAMTCHLAILAGLVWVGTVHFRDPTIGTAAAALYVLLPYTALHVSQTHHIWPAALILWATATYTRPRLAGALLGTAAGTSLFPLLLFPMWLNFYRGRGAKQFALGFVVAAGLCLLVVAGLLMFDGRLSESIRFTLGLSDWQPWKVPATDESIWSGAHWAYRMPVFVAYAALLCLTTIWPSPKDWGQLIALTAALLLGIQFWYSDRGGIYTLWYLPLLILMVFRPNLSGRYPVAVEEANPTREATGAADGSSRVLVGPAEMRFPSVGRASTRHPRGRLEVPR